ncbi:MAG: hypothetical protein ACM3TN_23515 [Alphaproteobacteria bacterium]
MDSETVSSTYTRDQTGLTSDEGIGALFQPDALLSAHYFETLRRKTILEPEKRLMLAILEDAINCFQNNLLAQNVRRRRLFEEAEEWIIEVDGDWVFSFENICEVLGFNPAYVHQGLLRWMENKLPKHRKGPSHGKERRWPGKVTREAGERKASQSSVRTERRLNCFNSD